MIWLCIGEYNGPKSVRIFIRYIIERMKQRAIDSVYRIYVSDVMKMVAANTAKHAGGEFPTKRYVDLIQNNSTTENSGEEIAAEIIKNCGLKVVS